MVRKIALPSVELLSAILAGCGSLDRPREARDVGVSDVRLKHLSAEVASNVQRGFIPGAVILVARDGKIVYSDAVGVQDPKSGAAMRPDAIFRLKSMTKPIVSVGIMMLVEEGRILLSDPASDYFPELKDQKVGIGKKNADGSTAIEEGAASRQMTIQDLLRQTSGYPGYFTKPPVKQKYLDSRVDSDPNQTLAEYVSRVAKLPLAYQPGTTWDYSAGTNILGAIIERVSGQTIDAFLSEKILRPLGMKDTGFWVDTAEQGRIAEPLAVDPGTKLPAQALDVRHPPRFLCADACMVSTASDYYRFAQMLLNGGQLDGVRILSRKSVEYMTADQLGSGINQGPFYMPGPGYGFGLGFQVRTALGEAAAPGSVGDYSWFGADGTFFFVDPKERLFGIYMMARLNPFAGPKFWRQFRTGVYSAID